MPEPMFKILTGVLGVLAIGVVGIHGTKMNARAERKIAAAADRQILASNADWARARVHGQKVVLTGAPPTPADGEALSQAVGQSLGPGGLVMGGVTTVVARFDSPAARQNGAPVPASLSDAPSALAKAAAPVPPANASPSDIRAVVGDTGDMAAENASLSLEQCRRAVANAMADQPVAFSPNRANIEPRNRQRLDSLAAILARCGDVEIIIEGHTDTSGDRLGNIRLSRLRADAVLGYLIPRVTTGAAFHSVGFGDSRPVASNETELGRARNRRIEIKISPLTNG